MTEEELRGFIQVVTNYFESISGEKAVMGLPYVKGAGSTLGDYTGLIGISGSRKGGIYFTTGRPLLEEFAYIILGEAVQDDDYLYDLVGEITNTIAGNMRETFGSTFLISIPIVLRGRVTDIDMKLKPPVFIIPITWKHHNSHLAIGLE
uniref:Chemotaxis protein CheX n=1 Tax=Gracilinema caldarium TaxID=215591 RepID=A0A7C3IDW8_9SPIR